MKFAAVSKLLPPASGGQSVLLYRLLKDFNPDDYCLISTLDLSDLRNDMSGRLGGRYFQISTEAEMTRGVRFGLALLREAYNVTVAAYSRARQIADIVKQENCEAILSCSSGVDLLDVPAGFYASRIARVPFYVYMFDTYSHMWLNPQTQFLGRMLEPMILKRAAGIIVTNESVRELLRKRYAVDSHVIHNPCDFSPYETELAEQPHNDQVSIVYTGAIYEAHYDAISNLLKAIGMLNRPNVKLHLYTSFSREVLEANGITGPVVFHGHIPASSIPEIQRRADILFLPLAFKSPYPELIKVSSPSKVGEFLASGRPVLAHAPEGSFISEYFRKYDCGLVVDEDDPGLLVEPLARLLDEPDLVQRLTVHAWKRAITDFGLDTAQLKLAEVMKLKLQVASPVSSSAAP